MFEKYYIKVLFSNLKSIIIAIAVIMLFASCRQNELDEIKAISKKDKVPVISAEDVKVLYSEEAKIKVIIQSPVMNRYIEEKKYLEMPEGMDVVFYDSLDNPKSTLTANYAISYEDEHKMEAKNDVVVVNEKGEKLNTEHLVWDQNKRKIYSDEFVKITSPDRIIFGQGMESDEKMDNWKIKKVSGIFNVKSDLKNNSNKDSTNNASK
jgi:LPS export ABC transporter protein LptC